MNCEYCYNEIPDGVSICPSCGAPCRVQSIEAVVVEEEEEDLEEEEDDVEEENTEEEYSQEEERTPIKSFLERVLLILQILIAIGSLILLGLRYFLQTR